MARIVFSNADDTLQVWDVGPGQDTQKAPAKAAGTS